MAIGLLIGVILGIAVATDVRVNGLPFLVAVGLAKLTFVSALGFLGAGAAVRRLGIRNERRKLSAIARPNEELKPTATESSLVE
jgi:hypothetical protein